MLINDLLELAMNIPSRLATGWAVWFFVGLLLSIWGRREKAYLIVHSTTKHKSGVRAAAASKPPSGVRAPVKPATVPVATTGGDFSDLERLFEEPQAPAHRTPGEKPSPVLAEMTVTGSNGAALATPQSLP
jgi:hypothetical protein